MLRAARMYAGRPVPTVGLGPVNGRRSVMEPSKTMEGDGGRSRRRDGAGRLRRRIRWETRPGVTPPR